MSVKPCAIAVAIAILSAGQARAAEDDFQAWAAATASIPVGEKGVVWLEAQGRFSDDASRLGQLLIRPGFGIRLTPRTTAYLGYAHVTTRPISARHTTEHRIWQQLSFPVAGRADGVTMTARSRFEQRFVEGSSDMGLRFRQLLRITAPIGGAGDGKPGGGGGAGSVRAVAWAEGFVALDDTAWGQRQGFDRLRSFAGVAVPLARGVSVEPGYMNEYVRRAGRDRANHIASLTVNTSF